MANRKQRQHQSGNPARRAAGSPSVSQEMARTAGPPSPTRSRLERVSAPILLRLHALPRWLIPVVMGLVLAGGLFLEGQWLWLGALLLGFVTLTVAWLYALSWPLLSTGSRIGRGLVVVGLAGITFLKATGRL